MGGYVYGGYNTMMDQQQGCLTRTATKGDLFRLESRLRGDITGHMNVLIAELSKDIRRSEERLVRMILDVRNDLRFRMSQDR